MPASDLMSKNALYKELPLVALLFFSCYLIVMYV
jgi:hypothetical protein